MGYRWILVPAALLCLTPATATQGRLRSAPISLEAQGWSIVALAESDRPAASRTLEALRTDPDQPELVRLWAAAARIRKASNGDELAAYTPWLAEHPSLVRPFIRQVQHHGLANPRLMLEVIASTPELDADLMPLLVAADPTDLVDVMLTADEQETRRIAASTVASAAVGDQRDQVIYAVLERTAFPARPGAVPWAGGPLYIPSAPYSKAQAQSLVGDLLAWYAHCDGLDLNVERQQAFNALNNVGLLRRAGVGSRPELAPAAALNAYGDFLTANQTLALLRRSHIVKTP